VFLFENSFFLLKADLNFKLKEERVLGDDTENSLYQIIDGEKVYYLATNKILENSKLGAGVKYLGSDIFWNPERCAQMKSFYTKEKIYFLDVVIANPKENSGEYYKNLAHVYDLSKNSLTTYELGSYLNILEIDKTKFALGGSDLEVYFMDEDSRIYAGTLNIDNLTIRLDCGVFTCDFLEKLDYETLRPEIPENIYDLRPYIFRFTSSDKGKKVLNLSEEDKIYHYLVGF
jgi:hypothetical protein